METKSEKCSHCGKHQTQPIYKIDSKPYCKECFPAAFMMERVFLLYQAYEILSRLESPEAGAWTNRYNDLVKDLRAIEKDG